MTLLKAFFFVLAVMAITLQINAQAEDEESNDDIRLFFTPFPRIVSCNSTAEAGTSCRSCTEALRCFSNNFGLLTPCRGLFRHCNNGRCSLTQSAACSNSTSSG